MFTHINNMLRHLLMMQVVGLRPDPYESPEGSNKISEEQVRFQAPDEVWRTHVQNLQRNALNIYLADLRENRKLHSNARSQYIENGLASQALAPRRIDCHYLISSWSPVEVTQDLEPARFADRVVRCLERAPASASIDLDGVGTTAALLQQLIRSPRDRQANTGKHQCLA